MVGAPVVLMDRFVPIDFAELIHRYAIRSTVLPPAAMNMLTDDPSVSDLTPLRYVRSITAPLSPLSARRFMAKFGVTVLNGYGQAEIGEVIGWTAADARDYPEKPARVAFPLSARMDPLGDDSLDDRTDHEGYVRTGDIALVDEHGFVWIEGRSSDLINRGGNKVFPDEVEEVLLLLDAVKEAAVASGLFQ